MLFSAVKWIGACSEDAVYEGWEPVPWTITPGSVLNVHWVQAVCELRENSSSRQGQQRALSTMVSCRCLGMHCITTVMQNCYITRIKGKERQERNRFKGHCKQSAFISKISYAMASWLHEIDRRGYNECFTSITWPRCHVTSENKAKWWSQIHQIFLPFFLATQTGQNRGEGGVNRRLIY